MNTPDHPRSTPREPLNHGPAVVAPAADELAGAVAAIRLFVDSRPAPDLAPAVMARIAGQPVPGAGGAGTLMRRLLRSLWSPREVRVRPAYALLGAAAAMLLALMPPTSWVLGGSGDAATRHILVQFRLDAAQASDVRLAGTFSGWEPRYTLDETAPGIWTVIVSLPHGIHEYAFIVDGRHWVADPHAPQVDDGFGGTNSRMALLPPGEEPHS